MTENVAGRKAEDETSTSTEANNRAADDADVSHSTAAPESTADRCVGATFAANSTAVGSNDRRVTFTFGASRTQTKWTDRREMSWAEFRTMLTTHTIGIKEGSCIVPARFSGTQRLRAHAEQIDVLMLDSDCGHALKEIEAAIRAKGWTAVISSTHSHMTTTADFALTAWEKFKKERPDATPADFLTEIKGLLPRIAYGATMKIDGTRVIFDHHPCPKFRIALLLDKPWCRADFSSAHQDVDATWKAAVEWAAAELSLHHDQSCSDASRLFYLPRHAEGAVPETAIIDGVACPIDWAAMAVPHRTPAAAKAGIDGAATVAAGLPPEMFDQSHYIARAIRFLQTCPEAIQGSKGDKVTYSVACTVRSSYAISEYTCLGLMATHYNPRCSPPWPVTGRKSLETKVRSAYRSTDLATGGEHPRAEFSPIADELPEWVIGLNQDHMIVNEAGKTWVFRRRYDPGLEREVIERSTFNDFTQRYRGDLIEVGNGKKKSRGAAWLDHPGHRNFPNGVTFLPGKQIAPSKGVYNLWQGFRVRPVPGSWAKLADHIRQNVCNGDEAVYRYLIGWMARCVQNPGEQGHVALVMRGGKGVGKGILARMFGGLFGQHFVHISTGKHLVGNFNAHLRDAVVVFADEAFWAGDKQHESVLKALVTEPTITIEAKYANAVQAPNYVHLIIASNDDWVVPASDDERRFLVLDVASHRQGDVAYFKAIEAEMADGGSAAMLHDLMDVNLSGFDVRKVPQTAALADQKLHSLDDIDSWWRDVLAAGEIDHSGFGSGDWTNGIEIPRDSVFDHYVRHAQRARIYKPKGIAELGNRLRELAPGLKSTRPAGDQGRGRCYAFPPLADCRAAFDKKIGRDIDWEEE
jgi:hypothetical protein